jgi:hypothetical protein
LVFKKIQEKTQKFEEMGPVDKTAVLKDLGFKEEVAFKFIAENPTCDLELAVQHLNCDPR